MSNNNETVEQVCSVLYTYPKAEVCDGSVLTVLNNDKIADRILAAHKREIAEMKHWIKSAARWIKCHDIYHTSGDDLIKQAKEILNDDGEFLFKKGEQ